MKTFNLILALAGHAVCTKDGRTVTNVKVVCDDFIEDDGVNSTYRQGLRADIHNDTFIDTYLFYHTGIASKYLGTCDADLYMR
jgi:hypothetical protein